MAKGFGNKATLEQQLAKMQETAKKEGANKTKMYDMCRKVIDKCLKVMPEANVPYDRIMPSFVPILYQIGEKKKAQEIINILVDQEYKNFTYYSSLAPRFCVGTLESAQVSFRIIGMLEQVARDSKDTKTADMVRSKEDAVAMQLDKWVRRCLEENQEYAASFVEYFPQFFQQQSPQGPPMPPAQPVE
ncbi:MAG TPA: hypothetical protein VD905_06790, partial [Flavobacteriales bacterium]|nr:hypothetical protein [Flavobacteriales bacterium]